MGTGSKKDQQMEITAEDFNKEFGADDDNEIGPWGDGSEPPALNNAFSQEDYQNRIEEQIEHIQADTIEEQIIGGEIVLKIQSGQDFASINGKEQFGFRYMLPRYDKKGERVYLVAEKKPNASIKMQNKQTGKFRIKAYLSINNQNIVSWSTSIF